MEVISTELFKKLTEMAKTDETLKNMLIDSNRETFKHKAFPTNAFRMLEMQLYKDLNNYLEKLSYEELVDKNKIKNSDEIENIVCSLIPPDGVKLSELMLDFNIYNLSVKSTIEDENIYNTIELSLCAYLKDFAYKTIDSYERVDF